MSTTKTSSVRVFGLLPPTHAPKPHTHAATHLCRSSCQLLLLLGCRIPVMSQLVQLHEQVLLIQVLLRGMSGEPSQAQVCGWAHARSYCATCVKGCVHAGP